jgi:hypothetical protein
MQALAAVYLDVAPAAGVLLDDDAELPVVVRLLRWLREELGAGRVPVFLQPPDGLVQARIVVRAALRAGNEATMALEDLVGNVDGKTAEELADLLVARADRLDGQVRSLARLDGSGPRSGPGQTDGGGPRSGAPEAPRQAFGLSPNIDDLAGPAENDGPAAGDELPHRATHPPPHVEPPEGRTRLLAYGCLAALGMLFVFAGGRAM